MTVLPLLESGASYLIAAAAVAVFVSLYHLLAFFASTTRTPKPSELAYRTPFPHVPTDTTSTLYPLPSTIRDQASVDISLIIPAFNETGRLPIMLDEALAYLKKRKSNDSNFSWEIVVMDDCSSDGTLECALKWGKVNGSQSEVRVVRLLQNRGKGGGIKQGMLRARGKILLMVDADGATKFSDLNLLEKELKRVTEAGLGIAIGSRAHLVSTDAVVKRSFIRNFLMCGFHWVLLILGIRGVGDTQCGFKLFTREAARLIFPNQHVEGWIFDVEVLLLAGMFGIPIVEVPVTWREVDGSKMSLAVDSFRMLKDLVIIRGNYLLGVWKAKKWEDDPYAEMLDKYTLRNDKSDPATKKSQAMKFAYDENLGSRRKHACTTNATNPSRVNGKGEGPQR